MVLQPGGLGAGVGNGDAAGEAEREARRSGSIGNRRGGWEVDGEAGFAEEAGGPLEMTVKGSNSITVHDVLVGEVWVCSGQSNMGTQVGGVKDRAQGNCRGGSSAASDVHRGEHRRR